MDYCNVLTYIIDLITVGYDGQLYTIHTNLIPIQIEEKYEKHIVDRLNELVEIIVFENETCWR